MKRGRATAGHAPHHVRLPILRAWGNRAIPRAGAGERLVHVGHAVTVGTEIGVRRVVQVESKKLSRQSGTPSSSVSLRTTITLKEAAVVDKSERVPVAVTVFVPSGKNGPGGGMVATTPHEPLKVGAVKLTTAPPAPVPPGPKSSETTMFAGMTIVQGSEGQV
jgi:hypothetical protein